MHWSKLHPAPAGHRYRDHVLSPAWAGQYLASYLGFCLLGVLLGYIVSIGFAVNSIWSYVLVTVVILLMMGINFMQNRHHYIASDETLFNNTREAILWIVRGLLLAIVPFLLGFSYSASFSDLWGSLPHFLLVAFGGFLPLWLLAAKFCALDFEAQTTAIVAENDFRKDSKLGIQLLSVIMPAVPMQKKELWEFWRAMAKILDSNVLPEEIRVNFHQLGITLSQQASISITVTGEEWSIVDGESQFVLRYTSTLFIYSKSVNKPLHSDSKDKVELQGRESPIRKRICRVCLILGMAICASVGYHDEGWSGLVSGAIAGLLLGELLSGLSSVCIRWILGKLVDDLKKGSTRMIGSFDCSSKWAWTQCILMLVVSTTGLVVFVQFGYWGLNNSVASSNTTLTYVLRNANTREEAQEASASAFKEKWLVSGFYARPCRWLLTDENKRLSPHVLDALDTIDKKAATRVKMMIEENSSEPYVDKVLFLNDAQGLLRNLSTDLLREYLLALNRGSSSHEKYCHSQPWARQWYNWVVDRRQGGGMQEVKSP